MYGTQTLLGMLLPPLVFENDVKMYGTQTTLLNSRSLLCLRMM